MRTPLEDGGRGSGWGIMSLQSRRGVVVRGNPEKNIPTGTRFRFVKRAADARTSEDAVQAPAGFKVPCGIFFSGFPPAGCRWD